MQKMFAMEFSKCQKWKLTLTFRYALVTLKGVLRTLLRIKMERCLKIFDSFQPLNYFRKRLHFRCSAGFWIHFWYIDLILNHTIWAFADIGFWHTLTLRNTTRLIDRLTFKHTHILNLDYLSKTVLLVICWLVFHSYVTTIF